MIHGHETGAQHVLRYVCPTCELSRPLLEIDTSYWTALGFDKRVQLINILSEVEPPVCTKCHALKGEINEH